MLDEESDPRLLACVISAIGYQYNPELLPNILRFKDHEDRSVRFHVASAVGGLLNPDSPDPRAIEGLVALASDEDADVRYDALSTLLEYLSKNPEILRPVVQARSDDTDEQVRGLARAYIATTDSDA
jgi:HEAT repeat protein